MVVKFSAKLEARILDGIVALEEIAKTLKEINGREKGEKVVLKGASNVGR